MFARRIDVKWRPLRYAALNVDFTNWLLAHQDYSGLMIIWKRSGVPLREERKQGSWIGLCLFATPSLFLWYELKGGGSRSTVADQQVKGSILHLGHTLAKIYRISPSPRCSIALQCSIVAWDTIYSFGMIANESSVWIFLALTHQSVNLDNVITLRYRLNMVEWIPYVRGQSNSVLMLI